MTRYCSNCGEPTEADDQFCHHCGESLADQSDKRSRAGRSGRPGTGTDASTNRRGTDSGHRDGTHRDDQWTGQSDRTGHPSNGPGPGGAAPRIQRMGALATLGQSLRWLLGFPILIAAFLIGDLLSNVQFFVSPTLGPLVQLGSAIVNVLIGGIAYVYVDREIRNETVAFGAAASTVLDRTLSLIGILVVYAIAITIGLILLVLPGIYLGARLILAFPACVLDEQGVSDSLSTSWGVADGNVLKLIGIFILSLLPLFGIFLIAGLTGGVESIENFENPTVFLLSAPISAIVAGMIEMATARVYLENR